MKTVAIIQARMSSTRLPGKVLKRLNAKPMILHVVDRVRAARLVDQVVVATSTDRADDPLAEVCTGYGAECFRGDETDVLDRYYQAALSFQADTVVRNTADCPLLDPEVIDRVIEAFSADKSADYAANRSYQGESIRHTYPVGLDTEVFTFQSLRRAWNEASLPSEREHVTPYIWKHPEWFGIRSIPYLTDLSDQRWTVDYPEDFTFAQAVYNFLDEGAFSMEQVLDVLRREPGVSQINSQVPRTEGWNKSLAADLSAEANPARRQL